MDNGPWRGPFFITTVYGNSSLKKYVIVDVDIKIKGWWCATAALSVLGMRLGKSRVCEIGHEVLCQIYTRGEVGVVAWLEDIVSISDMLRVIIQYSIKLVYKV